MDKKGRKVSLVAKPIEATPVLKGNDLASLVQSLYKKDSQESKLRRQSAFASLKKVRK